MLNKIKLITAVLFLGTSLASAETYNEFRAKNGMDSKGKTVKSSTSAQFQRATPKNVVISEVENNNQASELQYLRGSKEERAANLTTSVIGTWVISAGFDSDYNDKKNMLNYRVHSFGKYIKFTILNFSQLDDFSLLLVKRKTPLLMQKREECLKRAKRWILDGKKISRFTLYVNDYNVESSLNNNKVLIQESYSESVCGYTLK